MRKSRNIQKRKVFSFVVDGKCELWYLQLLKQQENLNIHLEPKLPHKKSLKDQKCQNNANIVVIVNNPCLEFWHLLHFEQTAKYFQSYEQLENALKQRLPEYDKTERYYKNARQNIYQCRHRRTIASVAMENERFFSMGFQ